MEMCNTDKDNSTLSFKELITCMKNHNVTKEQMKEAGNILLKYAYIPTSKIPAIAAGI